MHGIVACEAYIPYHRLERAAISTSLGGGVVSGARSVASYDEDATSMAVEAARSVLRTVPTAARPRRLYLATTVPPYLDKTNATVAHSALALDSGALAVDMCGGVRSGAGAFLAAAEASEPAMALLSDIRTGLPGSADEREGGDAAAAVLFGPGDSDTPVLAEVVSAAAETEEFLDRWRAPGDLASRVWEDRFAEHVYVPLAMDTLSAALKKADLTPGGVDHLVVCGLPRRSVRRVAAGTGIPADRVVPDLAEVIGNPGTAQLGVLLAAALRRAGPGDTIALLLLADGATAFILRTTAQIGRRRPAAPLAGGGAALRYPTFLNWRGMLAREPPRRPDPEPPAAPPAYRSRAYKHAFTATRCTRCGRVSLPPAQVCFHCGAVDTMESHPMARAHGTVATFTVDRLAFTPHPPMIAVVVDFDGGGRFRCELTDADASQVAIGDPVEMTFRRLLTADGVHNYFWKARPVRRAGGET
ncbi:OB-fold domain-containing protein [Frankia sp. QA3]|uniref:OB-fold domain-containing protein n=1 Tax=Frankia sp. QA3 TaxID=710111 RepID=UPI000269B9D5|nr:OB-fold domain-containing protein [Frankia sp. QA3]EIV90854.1 3-hydroxy-3-methylglutaryl CoA synthase [Frankia sp. QA3]